MRLHGGLLGLGRSGRSMVPRCGSLRSLWLRRSLGLVRSPRRITPLRLVLSRRFRPSRRNKMGRSAGGRTLKLGNYIVNFLEGRERGLAMPDMSEVYQREIERSQSTPISDVWGDEVARSQRSPMSDVWKAEEDRANGILRHRPTQRRP